MWHCDPEVLALAALGERIPDQDAAHLESCEQCTADAAELVELVMLGREAPLQLPPVPDQVWDGIRQELGLGRDAVADPPGAAAPTAPPMQVGDEVAQVLRMEPREARPRSARVRFFAVGAVAATVGAVLGGTVIWAVFERDVDAVRETVVAQAVLAPLSPSVATPGKAQVLESADGLVVRVDARGLPANSGFHEVWLLDANATKLVSLGALPSGSVGTFTIPPGVTLKDFPVVDISLEPYDGNPAHSHDSLMRGTLEA
jgi:hypothetical protein